MPAQRMKTSVGRLETIFAAITLVAAALWIAPGQSLLESVVILAAMTVALVVFARHWKQFVETLLWRLRNRLIVAYMLIAMVPVVLLSAMIGIGGYIILGQVSVYLITSQIERSTGMLRGAMRLLAVSGPSASAELRSSLPPAIAENFPGLEVLESDGKQVRYWPPGIEFQDAPAEWGDVDGLVLREGTLWGWAHVRHQGRTLTAVFPLTRDFLGQIAPNLGESVIVDVNRSTPLHPRGPRREGTLNRVPPALNSFDIEIRWGNPVRVAVWDKPGTYIDPADSPTLAVATRVSAVMRAISPQFVAGSYAVNLLIIFSVLFVIAETIALFVGVSISRTITGAVHDLYEGTVRVMRGDFSHRIPIHGKDQLAELGISFNQMTGNVERLLQVEKDRQRIQSDLEIAREVQDQLYPRSVPETDALRITAARSPARLVSGDYYDFQRLGNGDVAVAIGDVAGKGISAALLMATIQSSFRMELRGALEAGAAAGSPGSSVRAAVAPGEVVSRLNKHLYEFTSAEKYATFFCGVYDNATGTLLYTNAGHLPPILIRHSKCSRLDVNGMVVGAFPFAQYGESRIAMEPGDLMVLFTDGISEPENEYGEMFGEDRLAELVVRSSSLNDSQVMDEIMSAVRQWTGSDELQDDMTVVLIRRV